MKPGAVVLATGRELAAGFTNEVKSRGGYAETVGSVRRCRPIVGDVEALVRDLPEPEVAAAIEAVGGRRGPPNKAGARAPWGPRYYRAVLPAIGAGDRAVGLDVFVVRPPAEWGLLKLIRTGAADFSQAVVTRLHRYGLKAENGRVIHLPDRAFLPTSTEECVLRLARLPWIPPSEREMDNPATVAAFRGEAAPWECADPPGPRLLPVVAPAPSPSDRPPPVLCPTCGMVHPRGGCP